MNVRARFTFSSLLLISLGIAWMGTSQAQEVQVNSADPSSAEQGTVDLDVEIRGSGFDNSAAVEFFVTGTTNPGGITVKNVKVRGNRRIIATIDVDDLADVDDFDIEVRLSRGRNGKGTTLFRVKQKPNQQPDTTPPAQIDDFRTWLPTSDNIRLLWTATGDDGNTGTADHYTLRQAEQTSPSVCDGPGPYDFSAADNLQAPWPRDPGQGHEEWAEGLSADTCYAFELQVFDEAGNTPGPTYTAAITQAAPPAGAWETELVPPGGYGKYLEFDPATGQPIVLGETPHQNYHYWRSLDGTWSYQKVVKKSGSGSIALAYNDVTGKFGGVIQNSKNIPSYVELQSNGSWDAIQITRDRVRIGGQALAFDSNGMPAVAYRHLDGFIQVARHNGSSFDIETPPIPGGWEPHIQFHPGTGQLTIVYASEDKQDIVVATAVGSAWSVESIRLGQDIGSDIQTSVFSYDSNNEPIIIFTEALYIFWEYWAHMLRQDSGGNWAPANAVMIDPVGLLNQNPHDMVIANDGTLYLAMSSTGNQARVGRFCEAGRGFSCAPTMDSSGQQNVWHWETVAESVFGGGTISIAIDEVGGTVAIITDGLEHNSTEADSFSYMTCNPLSSSVICGIPPTP